MHTLSELLTSRLEQLGKTPYWLADESGYDVKNIYKVLKEDRAIPDKWVPRFAKALGWDEGTEAYQEYVSANNLLRTSLKEDSQPTLEELQRKLKHLEDSLDRATRVVSQQRAQIAQLREQRETIDTRLTALNDQLIEAVQKYAAAHLESRHNAELIARCRDLVAKFRAGLKK